MKVRELIELLKKQDPDLEVLIEQGEEWDYARVHSVEVEELYDVDGDDDQITARVCIKYQ